MFAKKSMLTIVFVTTTVITGLAVSCKARQTASQHKNGGNGGANSAVAPFAWELADLPACYSNNADAEVFVWRAQKTLKCNNRNGQWQ